MKVYSTDKIRNVVLLGHGSCGKTTLTEAMCNLAGLTSRMGSVEGKNTISDFTKEEQKRGISLRTAVVPIEWKDCKINVLDTPGFFDFVGEVEEAVGVADAAIIVISGKAGLEAGTERAWDLCQKYNVPRMFFVTDMDADASRYHDIVQTLEDKYGSKIAPISLPIIGGDSFDGFVSVIAEKGYTFDGKGVKECEVPAATADDMSAYRDLLMEAVAESSEEFMERYFGGDTFTDDEISQAVMASIQDGSIVPVSMGSGLTTKGISQLLNDIIFYLPSPKHCKISGTDMKSGEAFEANYDDAKAKSAYVFKTIVDPFIGRYSLIKINSGVLKTDDSCYDSELESELKIGKLYVLRGNQTQEVPEAHAGDIIALAKLGDVKTGDSLSTKATQIRYEKTEISKPYTYIRYKAKNKGDIDKIAQAMAKISAEDTTFRNVNDAENRQTLMYGIGDLQLDVVRSMLQNEYKVEIETEKPKVAFRETIRKNSDVEYKYKKQSGGHGQYGHVKMRFSPMEDQSQAYTFEQEVVGGSVPKNYYPAVEKGIIDSVQAGPLAAYPVVGVKAVLYDGSYHPVDSSEMAFKTASRQAFKKGFMEAGPVLLEPIVTLKVVIPDSYTGDVMGDLNKRRGRVLGMNPIGGGKTCVEAEVPQMELFDYCTVLRSMTGGRGDFSYDFARYEQAPAGIQQAEVEARAAELAEENEE
ncbi:MAG: elongation factor G [Lachnospiraceae bacterium]|nr:elongation factor G [Lachnospiraceae bacterium]